VDHFAQKMQTLDRAKAPGKDGRYSQQKPAILPRKGSLLAFPRKAW